MADYLTNTTELTAVADAIRAKGGTTASLVYPDGFVSAIGDIESGGGGSSGLVLNIIISGSTYTLDKTVSEIVQALNSGISPVFIETDGAYKKYYPLKSANLDSHTYNDDSLRISCTGYADNFSAIGSSAYPSFTKAGGGGSND